MKRAICLVLMCMFVLSCCGKDETEQSLDKSIVGKWIDTTTEQIVEYTADGFYYEYINEGFTTDKTRFLTENGKIYYYLDGDKPNKDAGMDYEIKDGILIIGGFLEYRPLDLKTEK